ncbi:MAG: WD40 repeat domain-containing protein [Halobacteriales archaeon]|nr:WD40 repeat domain-containing protein [Halobacteriales archaeon]
MTRIGEHFGTLDFGGIRAGTAIRTRGGDSCITLAEPAHGLDYSPDNRTVAVVGKSNDLYILDTANGLREADSIATATLSAVSDLEFTPDGNHLLVVETSDDGGVAPQLLVFDTSDWSLETNYSLPTPYTGHIVSPKLAVSPDSSECFVVGGSSFDSDASDGTNYTFVIEPLTGNILQNLDGALNTGTDAEYTPNGDYVLMSEYNLGWAYDTSDWSTIRVSEMSTSANPLKYNSVAVAPDNETFAFGGSHTTNNQEWTTSDFDDGSFIAIPTEMNRDWQVLQDNDEFRVATYAGASPTPDVSNIEFSPKGNGRFAAGLSSGHLHFFDTDEVRNHGPMKSLIDQPTYYDETVLEAEMPFAYSPDGTKFVYSYGERICILRPDEYFES